jgi:hypothetical protein
MTPIPALSFGMPRPFDLACGTAGRQLAAPLQRRAGGALAAGVLSVPPLFWAIPTAYLRGAAAAAGIAIINSFGNLAGFIRPYFFGWIKTRTGSTPAGICIIAVCVLIAGILVIAAPAAREAA